METFLAGEARGEGEGEGRGEVEQRGELGLLEDGGRIKENWKVDWWRMEKLEGQSRGRGELK